LKDNQDDQDDHIFQEYTGELGPKTQVIHSCCWRTMRAAS